MQILCGYFGLVVDVEYSHVLFSMIFFPLLHIVMDRTRAKQGKEA